MSSGPSGPMFIPMQLCWKQNLPNGAAAVKSASHCLGCQVIQEFSWKVARTICRILSSQLFLLWQEELQDFNVSSASLLCTTCCCSCWHLQQCSLKLQWWVFNSDNFDFPNLVSLHLHVMLFGLLGIDWPGIRGHSFVVVDVVVYMPRKCINICFRHLSFSETQAELANLPNFPAKFVQLFCQMCQIL